MTATHAKDWIDPSGGNYYDATNWSPAGVPSNFETIVFDLGVSTASAYTVAFDRNVNPEALLVGNDAVVFDLDGNTLTLDLASGMGSSSTDNAYLRVQDGRMTLRGSLDVGYVGTATLDIRNAGAVSANSIAVGGFFPTTVANGNGTISVDGGGSSLSVSGDLKVGVYNKGVVEVKNGADVSTARTALGVNAGSSATASIDGTGSTWRSIQATDPTITDFYIGQRGDAAFSASGGAAVTSGRAAIGWATGAIGELTLAEAGTSFTSTAALSVGSSGKGTVTVKQGASLVSSNAQVGLTATGTGGVTLSDTGSSWTIANRLDVGSEGSGTVAVFDGTSLASQAGYVGTHATGTGAVEISGAGASWSNRGNLYVGDGGDGSVDILGGGALTSANAFVARQSGSQGAVTVSGAGSSWANSGSIDVGGSSTGSGGNGSLDVLDGGAVAVGDTLTLWNGARLTVDGGAVTTKGLDSKEGSLFLQGGSITVDGGIFEDDDLYLNGADAADSPTLVMRDGAAGTLAENGTNRIGFSRDGNLVIQDGAALTMGNDISIGHLDGATGSVIVEGGGSRWDLVAFASSGASNALMVGRVGDGSVLVRDGGSVTTGTLHTWIGQSTSATGTVTVDGPSSSIKTADLDVGSFGQGALVVSNGGTVTSGPTAVGGESGGNGTVTVTGDGSFFGLDDGLVLGGTAGAAGGSGLLQIGPGATVSVRNGLRLWSGGTVALNGGTLEIDTLHNDGTLGFNAGTLKTSGDFNVADLGTLTDLSVLKHLHVAGTATLDGSSILALNGGSFTAGAVLSSGGLVFNSGTFRLTDANLTIGNGGLFGSLALFSSGQSLIVDKTTTVNDGATLQVDNTEVFSQVLVNDGLLGLSGLTARINGGDLANNGLLVGSGRIGSSLANSDLGEVRIATGDMLTFAAANNTNNGTIRLLGGIAEFTGALTNGKTGQVLGNGVLIAEGGLANQGEMSFSGQSTDVFGDVNHTGRLRVSGNSVATFYNDFANNGSEFRVSSGSTAVFFGAYSGGSSISGLGTVLFDGTVNFGNSPGRISIGGDVVFGSDNELIVELAGTEPGTEYDQLLVSGELVLGGTLRFVLLDDFLPMDGDVFEALIADGGLSGDFANVFVPEVAGYEFQLLRNATSLSLAAKATSPVPLPAAAWLFLGALGLLATRAGRRRLH